MWHSTSIQVLSKILKIRYDADAYNSHFAEHWGGDLARCEVILNSKYIGRFYFIVGYRKKNWKNWKLEFKYAYSNLLGESIVYATNVSKFYRKVWGSSVLDFVELNL